MSPDTQRAVLMLGVIFRAGRQGVTAAEILAALPRAMRVHVRSVQRDLVALATWAPIECSDDVRPYRWRAVRGAACPCCQRRSVR
jgi:predicted DNA-binding transcriptional regulator YafY